MASSDGSEAETEGDGHVSVGGVIVWIAVLAFGAWAVWQIIQSQVALGHVHDELVGRTLTETKIDGSQTTLSFLSADTVEYSGREWFGLHGADVEGWAYTYDLRYGGEQEDGRTDYYVCLYDGNEPLPLLVLKRLFRIDEHEFELLVGEDGVAGANLYGSDASLWEKLFVPTLWVSALVLWLMGIWQDSKLMALLGGAAIVWFGPTVAWYIYIVIKVVFTLWMAPFAIAMIIFALLGGSIIFII